jgi:hypothetical protein
MAIFRFREGALTYMDRTRRFVTDAHDSGAKSPSNCYESNTRRLRTTVTVRGFSGVARMKGRAKRTTLGWAFLALVVSVPASVVACGDEESDPSGGGKGGGSGSGVGGTGEEGGMGGAAASGADAGAGGSQGGTAGDAATGGSSGTSDAGEDSGGAGGGPPVSDCDLSGDEKPLVVLPNDIESAR